MNPYASWLGGRSPLAVIRETPTKLRAALAAADPDAAWAEGKWSRRQVAAHLADTELVFGMRLRQTLAEDHHIIQPFDQDAWAKDYASTDLELALSVFETVRAWNIRLIESAKENFDKKVTHPERGTMTFATLVETMAGHDLNHLAQLQGKAAPAAGS